MDPLHEDGGVEAMGVLVRSPTGQWPDNYVGENVPTEYLLTKKLIGNVSGVLHSRIVRPARDALSLLSGNMLGTRLSALGDFSGSLLSPTIIASLSAPSWHPKRSLLACISLDHMSVHLFDFTNRIAPLGQNISTIYQEPLHAIRSLRHELQGTAHALAWRPSGGNTIAVGCARGVCIWSLDVKDRIGTRLVWLQSPGQVPVHALAWHPKGHLLAGSSLERPGFFVWDVASGEVVSLRRGADCLSLLRWSPCGAYLLSATRGLGSVSNYREHQQQRKPKHSNFVGGTFRIWETSTWASSSWTMHDSGEGIDASSEDGFGRSIDHVGSLVGAEWTPDSKMVLLAYSNRVFTLHFTDGTPSLCAQVLPVSITDTLAAESTRLLDSGDGRLRNSSIVPGAGMIESIAWDVSGQRLAIALGQGHAAAGQIALFDTRCDPILSARLIGYINPFDPIGLTGVEDDVRTTEAQGWEFVEPQRSEEDATGDIDRTPHIPLSLVFWPGFHQGALLSVQREGMVASLPLYFSS